MLRPPAPPVTLTGSSSDGRWQYRIPIDPAGPDAGLEWHAWIAQYHPKEVKEPS